jgi:2-amino-4-hydroxy-6-hydroxymethyldihydropteridine diphosphokinase
LSVLPNVLTSSDSNAGPTQAAIALGSNLGDSLGIVNQAVQQLQQRSDLRILGQSAWYQTAPVGPPQPDYINGCLWVELLMDAEGQPLLTPQTFLTMLLDLEQRFGRVRGERWGARTLDLDLLLIDSLVLQTPTLELPHPRLRERAFVLLPLAEVLPDWQDPVSGLTVQQLCDRVDQAGVIRL